MKRYAIRLTETDIPFMAEADDGAWVKFDEAQVDQFKAGQAYENGVWRRALVNGFSALTMADKTWSLLLSDVAYERKRRP